LPAVRDSHITAKGTTKAEKAQRKEEKTHYHRADIEKMRGDQNVFKNNVDVFRTPHLYTGMQAHELEGDHETVLHNVKKKMVSNLVFLANHVKSGAFGSKDHFDKWKGWYDGAHNLARGLAEKHGAHVASAAGVIAGLSPQNDWDMNVHQAHVVMDTMTNHQHTAWSPEMTKHANKIWGKAKDPKIRNMVGDIQGKTLNQIEQEGGKNMHLRQAVWIRAYNEAHGSKHYREVNPDGSLGDFKRFTDGKKKAKRRSRPGKLQAVSSTL
jgi:hypothetical protein